MTIPTKEQALDALETILEDSTLKRIVFARDYELEIETLRTYIEGEKDSLGADAARKEELEVVDCPECFGTGHRSEPSGYWPCRKCYPNKGKITRVRHFAPSSAHVPGIEKVRVALEDIASGELGINVSIKAAKEALAILDQQAASESIQRGVLCDWDNFTVVDGHLYYYPLDDQRITDPLADLRATVEGMRKVIPDVSMQGASFDESLDYAVSLREAQLHNAALDAVLCLIDNHTSVQQDKNNN